VAKMELTQNWRKRDGPPRARTRPPDAQSVHAQTYPFRPARRNDMSTVLRPEMTSTTPDRGSKNAPSFFNIRKGGACVVR
jgi:hypothetical protein